MKEFDIFSITKHWFLSLKDAKVKIEEWWREYGSHRPHSAIKYKTPEEFAASVSESSELK